MSIEENKIDYRSCNPITSMLIIFSCQVKSTSSISSYKYIYYMHMIEFYILNSTLLIIIKFTIIGQAIQTASQIDYVEETFCGVIYMYVVVSLYTAKLYYYI